MRPTSVLLLLAASMLTPASARTPAGSRPTHQVSATAARRIVRHEWKALWGRGGRREETLFGQPRDLVASSDGVYVADGGGLEVFAFAPDGKLRWRIGRKGGGPGEFQHIDDITLDVNGDPIVLDPNNARLTVISKAGALRRTISTGAVPWVSSICALADGSVSTLTSSRDAYVTVLDSAGHFKSASAFPWPSDANAPTFLRGAQFARGVARDYCWLATTFGFGIAKFGNAKQRDMAEHAPFIEAVEAPVIRTEASTPERRGGQYLERGVNAALGAFTSADTLFVLFMGKQDKDKPLLDLYDRHGRYLESWNVPAGAERVAYAKGTLYVLANTMQAAAVIAFKASAAPTGKRSP